MKKNVIIYFLLAITGFFAACEDPYKDDTFKVYDEQSISAYLETRSGEFSEWIKVLKYADLYNALNQSGRVFTAFVPTNDAVSEFYRTRGVQGIEELGTSYARNLVLYHIVRDSVSQENFVEGGQLLNKTLTDDFLEVRFGEDDESGSGGYNSLYINGESHVRELSISTSNGLVYVLNDVMRPLLESAYQALAGNGNNTILAKAMEMTGWADTLNIISDQFEYYSGFEFTLRRYYTVLGVPDSIYDKQGISSVEDLIAYVGAGSDYTSASNELNRYVGYHILKGNKKIAALKTINTGRAQLWETCTTNALVKISREENSVYFLNFEAEGASASFLEEGSDYVVKNGYIHQLDNCLPVCTTLKPVSVLFDVCSLPEVESFIASYGKPEQVYQTASDTEIITELWPIGWNYKAEMGPGYLIPFDVARLGYVTVRNAQSQYSKTVHKDVLELRLGYLGNVTLTTPALLPGKYAVKLVYLYATNQDPISKGEEGNGAQTMFSFEDMPDSPVSNVVLYSDKTTAMGIYESLVFRSVEFNETSKHALKIVVNDPAASNFSPFYLRLDYIMFEPIN